MRATNLSLLALMALAGCAAVQPAPSKVIEAQAEMDAATAFSTTSTPYTKTSSSPFQRQVVLNRVIHRVPTGDSCNGLIIPNWDVTDLFPNSSTPELERFCVLTWNRTFKPTANHIPSGTIANMSHDRIAVVGLSGYTSSVSFDDLEDNTIDLVDPVKDFGAKFKKRARLTLIDSTPTSETPMTEIAFDSHGTRLAGLADAFVCDKQTGGDRVCAVDVESQLALGWEQTGTAGTPSWNAPSDGGSVGRISDIATAIVDAVDDWEDDRHEKGSTVGSLVLNLSLGWHPNSYATTNKAAAENAVLSALHYASCRGALVFAAAGHDDTPIGDAERDGASLPGAWETIQELSNSQCNTQFDSVNRRSRTSKYRPVVYAVGAVNGDLSLSSVTRPDSVPHLVAPGEYLTVTPSAGSPTGPNIPISGTSVATVVASSAAAVALSLDPTLSVHDAAVQVWIRGELVTKPNGLTADVYQGGSGLPVRVANVCATADAVCNGSCRANFDADCDDSAVPAATPTYSSTPSWTEIHPSTATITTGSCVGTSAQEYLYPGNANNESYECPVQQNDSASAIATVMPMPPAAICTFCPTRFTDWNQGGLVELNMTDPWGTYEDMTLSIHFGPGVGGSDHYPLQSLEPTYLGDFHAFIEMPVGSGHRDISNGGPPEYIPATGATLSYTGPDGFTYSEPLYLEY